MPCWDENNNQNLSSTDSEKYSKRGARALQYSSQPFMNLAPSHPASTYKTLPQIKSNFIFRDKETQNKH